MRLGVVGAGAFGTALAIVQARAGRAVVLWGRDREAMAAARARRELPRLPGATLPDGVAPTADPADLRDCDTVFVALPMQRLAEALPGLGLAPRTAVAACKGIELDTLRGATAILHAAMPDACPAILSGPGFAADIARGLPTAMTLACADPEAGRALQAALATPTLRLYRATDVAGVELGGAIKNVVAIACGAAIGAGFGESARAALMTRGMAEMMRLARPFGATRATLMGLSGLGDLALTCGSPASRNFALGAALGRGAPPPDALSEGAATAGAVLALGRRHDVDLPVTRVTAALVAGEQSVEDAVRALLDRDLTEE